MTTEEQAIHALKSVQEAARSFAALIEAFDPTLADVLTPMQCQSVLSAQLSAQNVEQLMKHKLNALEE